MPFVMALSLVPSARAEVTDDVLCPQTVELEGTAVLTRSLAHALARRGIGTLGIPGCPSVRARVEQRGGQLAVSVYEELRHVERSVADLATAATVIESWVRSDISAPLLSLREAPPPPKPAAWPTGPLPGVTGLLAWPRTRFAVEMLAEAAVDTDSAVWFGGSLRGCISVRPFCLGMVVRMAGAVPMRRKDFEDQRFAADVLVSLELPLRFGRFTLAPGIGVGAGWLRHEVQGVRTVTENSDDGYAYAASVHDGGMRGELRLLSVVSLRRGLELAIGASLCASFLNSPTVLIPVGKIDSEQVATAAWGALRTGVGLRWSTL